MFEILTIDQKGKEWVWNVVEEQTYEKEINDIYETRVEIESENYKRWFMKANDSIRVVLRFAGIPLKTTKINHKGEIEYEVVR